MQITRNAALRTVDAFLRETGASERHFGIAAVNDHRFVTRLRHDSVTLRVIERAEAFIYRYRRGELSAVELARLFNAPVADPATAGDKPRIDPSMSADKPRAARKGALA